MALLAEAANLGLQTPLTVGDRPFILWIAGTDYISRVSLDSWRLSHNTPTEPAQLDFVLDDFSATLGTSTLRIGDQVTWVETAPNGGLGRILFNGTIKRITPELGSTYANWKVSCTDLSEALDYGRPILVDQRPTETDQARIQYFLGNYALLDMSSGSGVASTATLGPALFQKMTLRQAIEHTLTAAGSGRNYYVDTLGKVHTYSGLEGTAAPYNITDTNPNMTTTIPATVRPVIDGDTYVDGVYVFGGNQLGSGFVPGPNPPLALPRYAYVDAPESMDSGSAYTIGQGEIAKRQTITRCTAQVQEFDGWGLGQTITVTEGPLGWSARQFQINSISMRVLSGTGKRQYSLELGPPGAVGKTTSLALRLQAADAARAQAGAPSTVPGSYSEGSVISPTGYTSGLRILDGVSDVFKIVASGTLERNQGDGTTGLTTVTLTGLGTWAETPASQSYVSNGPAVTDVRVLGSAWLSHNADSWVSPTSNGSTNRPAVTTQMFAQVFTSLDAGNLATVSLRFSNHTGGSNTAYARYYILQEVAI